MKSVDATFQDAGGPPTGAGPAPLRTRGLSVSLPELGTLVFLIALAASLRVYALAAKSLGFDEGVSVGIARLDWYNFLRILWRREANMSLYYLLLRFWLHWGSSESFIRALSAAFGLAALPAIFFLGRRLFDARVGLIAAALLAVNAYHIRYSREARSYSLLLLLCVLSSFYFLKCLDNPSSRTRITYVLISALAVYAHFFAGLLLVAQWLSLRFLEKPRIPEQMRRQWVWIAIAVAPVMVFVATTGAGPVSWIQRPGPRELWDFVMDLTGGGGPFLVIAYLAACLAAVLPAALERAAKRVSWASWRYRFLLMWILFPPLVTLAVSVARPLFLPRYFLLCLPAIVLLAASGLARLRSDWLLAPALLAFYVLSLGGTHAYYRQELTVQQDDWRTASQYLLSSARPGDALLFHIAMGRMPYEYYHSRASQSSQSPVVLYPHHGENITFVDFVKKPDFSLLERSLPQYQRVWLVLARVGDPSRPDAITSSLEKLLSPAYHHIEERHFPGMEVLLYSNDRASPEISPLKPRP